MSVYLCDVSTFLYCFMTAGNIRVYIENINYNLGEQRNIKTFHSKKFLTAHFLAVHLVPLPRMWSSWLSFSFWRHASHPIRPQITTTKGVRMPQWRSLFTSANPPVALCCQKLPENPRKEPRRSLRKWLNILGNSLAGQWELVGVRDRIVKNFSHWSLLQHHTSENTNS